MAGTQDRGWQEAPGADLLRSQDGGLVAVHQPLTDSGSDEKLPGLLRNESC